MTAVKTYDPKNVTVTVGGKVIASVGEVLYARGAVPYPVLELADHVGFSWYSVSVKPLNDGTWSQDPPVLRRVTGRRVPPSTLSPRDDLDTAGALDTIFRLVPAINAGDEGALRVAVDAALEAGWTLEVVSDGQAEAERLQSARTPTTMWRKEGDAEARCGGLKFFHPNQGGPLAKWIMDRIARTWHGNPLYRYHRKDGVLTDKRRVWEPKEHDLFGQAPFSEKRQDHVDDARTELFCVVAGCTNRRSTEDGLCLAHRDRPWEEGDREW